MTHDEARTAFSMSEHIRRQRENIGRVRLCAKNLDYVGAVKLGIEILELPPGNVQEMYELAIAGAECMLNQDEIELEKL